MNPIVVRDRIREALEDDNSAALSAPESVRKRIECLATTVRRHEADFGHRDRQFRRAPSRRRRRRSPDWFRRTAGPDMQGGWRQAMMSRRCRSNAGTAQIEQIRKPVRYDAVQSSGQRAGIDAHRIVVIAAARNRYDSSRCRPRCASRAVANAADPHRRWLQSPLPARAAVEGPSGRLRAAEFRSSRHRTCRSDRGNLASLVIRFPWGGGIWVIPFARSPSGPQARPSHSLAPSRRIATSRPRIVAPPGTRQPMPMTAIGSLRRTLPSLGTRLLGQQRELDGGKTSLRRRRGVHRAPDEFRRAARASASERLDKRRQFDAHSRRPPNARPRPESRTASTGRRQGTRREPR